MKVLGEFRIRMREQKKLAAQSSKADKEHQQAIEGLKAALGECPDSLRADGGRPEGRRPSKLPTQKRGAYRKRQSQERRRSQVSGRNWPMPEKAKQEAEGGKKEVEAKLANAEVDFVANFHNTEDLLQFRRLFCQGWSSGSSDCAQK
ncbi:hypothetical protein Adt_09925 [Abeliophyllum distichum]|uniref:Uncharacterized protein n=1 Tax=Abeliophyllum distichum TaxID=126358 RepID=A0ABD1UIT4_9LAMI